MYRRRTRKQDCYPKPARPDIRKFATTALGVLVILLFVFVAMYQLARPAALHINRAPTSAPVRATSAPTRATPTVAPSIEERPVIAPATQVIELAPPPPAVDEEPAVIMPAPVEEAPTPCWEGPPRPNPDGLGECWQGVPYVQRETP